MTVGRDDGGLAVADVDRQDITDRLEPSWKIEARCAGCRERTRRVYSSVDAERVDMQAWAALHAEC